MNLVIGKKKQRKTNGENFEQKDEEFVEFEKKGSRKKEFGEEKGRI